MDIALHGGEDVFAALSFVHLSGKDAVNNYKVLFDMEDIQPAAVVRHSPCERARLVHRNTHQPTPYLPSHALSWENSLTESDSLPLVLA